MEQDVEQGDAQLQTEANHQRQLRDPFEHEARHDHAAERAPAGGRRASAIQKRQSPVPVVTDISMDMGSRNSHRSALNENEIAHRLACLEERVSELCIENENLTRINDELSGILVEMTNKFKNDIDSLRDQLASIGVPHRPNPCNLRVAREMSDGCYEIVWDLPLVRGYKVLTNGVESGIVRAPNNAARISDVEPGMELSVQLQAIHFDGTLGEPSSPLIIRRNEQ
ncbi:unnamed protein product [Strongylus vulgaris]|uniref:Fibronectin type-III domain-containing protein n=1 Tax=Strongylus vulgaris TaxID=40348 RepID=A0A3P7IQV7_STRVU|nr:unnamed protein product [Strongylus vulgaris]